MTMTVFCSEVLSIPDDLSEKFNMVADMLIQERGAQKALAASLAAASNAKLYYNRSLITFQEVSDTSFDKLE